MSSGFARVLIVDDNADDLATYSRWLLACKDWRLTVITATSLATALEAFAQQSPDCVVVDYDLRDSTGLDVMAEVAQLGFDTPIIAIGAPPNPEPWRSLSYAPLRHVAALYHAAGAEVLNMPDVTAAGAEAAA